jgi:glycosyltransferase involved in cell wall biosynthesis
MIYKKFILAPTRVMNGGVGTFTKDFLLAFNDFRGISGDKFDSIDNNASSFVYVSGFDSRPTIKMYRNFYKFFTVNITEKIIYQGTLSLLVLPFLKLICPSASHIVIFHGLASKYTLFPVRLVEKFAAAIADKNVFLTKRDLILIGKKSNSVVISNYAPKNINNLASYDSKNITTVTRLSKQKNLAFNLAEFQSLDTFVLDIYGVGKNKIDLISYRNVTLADRANHEDMYSKKFAFCLSTYSEGFPLSILEASSFGLPLILSDLPELREICGDNALYFENNRAGSLASIVTGLKSDRDKYREYSSKAIAFANFYSRDKWYENLTQLLKNT